MPDDKLKAYITYPYTPTTKAVLLNEKSSTGYTIELNGAKLNCGLKLNQNIREDLKSIGAKISEVKIYGNSGKSSVFGERVKINIIKRVGVEAIRIRIESDNIEGLHIKISNIKKGMESYRIKPKMCIWSRIGKL